MGVLRVKDGFSFDCRKLNDKMGVLESFKSLLRGDIYNVDITCCLSMNGQLLIPAYQQLNHSFAPLTQYIGTDDTIESAITRFIRSNKPLFGIVGTFAVIGVFNLKFDTNTKQLIREKSNIEFYVPKKFYDTKEAIEKVGVSSPVLICDKLSTVDGISTYKVDEFTYKGYEESSIKQLTMDVLKSRENFILSRTKIGALNSC